MIQHRVSSRWSVLDVSVGRNAFGSEVDSAEVRSAVADSCR